MANLTLRRRRGYSLLEAMVAIAILGIAIAGALPALVRANQESREGELRHLKMVLIEAVAQRAVLGSKTVQGNGTIPALGPFVPLGVQTVDPATLALGASPWAIDCTPTCAATVVPGDLGTGAFFKLGVDDTIIPVTTLTATNCGDSAIPLGTYCREVLVAKGLPPAGAMNTAITTALSNAGTQPYTRWIRVSRKGEPAVLAAVYREVFVP